ncbi:hypothetical protein BH10ACI1_BH10ACI1_26480 [soil metagenome]
MKFLFILLILILVLCLVGLRFRKQIQTALYMWRMFRQMKQMSKPKVEKQLNQTENQTAAKLVKCAKCGAWTPLTKAIYFRSKTFYCSKKCMETLVQK